MNIATQSIVRGGDAVTKIHVMSKRPMRRVWYLVAALLLATFLLTTACATSGARSLYAKAEKDSRRELWDHAVLGYAKALSMDPGNSRYRVALARAKLRAAAAHFDRGKDYLKSGQLELAIAELEETVSLDHSNQYALNELEKALAEQERRTRGPSRMESARKEAARHANELGPPKLDPTANVPIALNFPDSTVEDVYTALSKPSGINFLYDEKLDLKKKTSVELSNVTFEKAMDILMLMHKHFYKVIDEHTILIAEDSRQKQAEYADQVIRTFYLSNAETKQVQTLLRALLETRRIHENPDLNAITIKDKPETIKIAERIIHANDKAKGEVVVDLELLEINRTHTQNLGMDLTSKSLSLVFGDGAQTLPLNALDVLKSKGAWSVGPVPGVVIRFLKSDSDTKSIAKPQIRILEGEDGKITIGDRVPIPATTFNSSNTIGGSVVPITSFTYQNVGIIIDVKPRVHHNKEVTLELKLEISSLAGSVEGSGGVSQPIIGTRTIETTLRLKDGETNLIAGLIKEDERSSLSGIPGISDIPFLRRIFGMSNSDRQVTDIVMSVTPHIIRVPNIEPIDLVPLWVGTEEHIQLRGVARNALGESPFSGASPWEEIDNQLYGDESPGGGERTKPAQVKVDVEHKPGLAESDATPGEGLKSDEGSSRRRRRPRPAPEEGLPEEGAFGDGAEPSDLSKKAEEPRRRSVAQIRLSTASTRVAPGETLGVELLISGAEDVGTVNFQLRYDPKVLQFVPPAKLGSFLQQGGVPVDLQAVEAGDGLVVVSAARAGETGADGSGGLVQLSFVALAEGPAGFAFSAAQVRAPDATALPASFRVANVEVAP